MGRLLVADTHYYRVLIYAADGELLETIGGRQGHGPGEFGLVTDAVQDSKGDAASGLLARHKNKSSRDNGQRESLKK